MPDLVPKSVVARRLRAPIVGIGLAASLLLTACGQRGPLVLPAATSPTPTASSGPNMPAPASAPASASPARP